MISAPILFVIEAAIKLRQKGHEVLVDSTLERPLALPVGELAASITEANATDFFERSENHHLANPEGRLYHKLPPPERVEPYKKFIAVNEQLGNAKTVSHKAIDIVHELEKFEQFRVGSNPPVQRLLGTIVELGVDYFVANPQALGRDSSAALLITAFVAGLDETDFAEGELSDIAGDVLIAGLRVFDNNTSLISSDQRIKVLLGGVTGALIDDYGKHRPLWAEGKRRDLFKRITASILRGAASAFEDHVELFIDDNAARGIVRSTVAQLLKGLEGKEDLFTNESLELLVRSALGAVAENAAFVSGKPMIQQIVRNIVEVLTETEDGKLFTEASVAAILETALQTLTENIETLVSKDAPERQFITDAVTAMAAGLATTLSGGHLKDVFSSKQLVELAQIVFKEVAVHPEHLLGNTAGDPKRTALAQIVASVAKALGDDPSKLISSQGALELIHAALRAAVQNVNKLLDLEAEDPTTNILYQMLHELVTALKEVEDPHRLLTRETFVDIAKRVMATTSANLDLILDGKHELVGKVVRATMDLTRGKLENRINGATLPLLIERLLQDVLLHELDLDNAEATAAAAKSTLRAA